MNLMDYAFTVIIALIALAALLSHHKVQILAHVKELVGDLQPQPPVPVPAPAPNPVSPPTPTPAPTGTQPGPLSPFPPGPATPLPVIPIVIPSSPPAPTPFPPIVDMVMDTNGQSYPVGTGDNSYIVPIKPGQKCLISTADFYDPVGGYIMDSSGKTLATSAIGPKLYLFVEGQKDENLRLIVTTNTMNPTAHVMRQGNN